MNIIVKPTSSNLWWGIYGLAEKTGWEDMSVYYENGEKIGSFCLNAKQYLRAELEELKNDPEEIDAVIAIKNYLKDNRFHYNYYYDTKDHEDCHEVGYKAPKNSEGIKPSYVEIWHPDENIGIATIKSTVIEFAKKFLGVNDCNVQIENVEEFDESVKSFQENTKLFNNINPIKIEFSKELIEELSILWQKSKEDVLRKLKN